MQIQEVKDARKKQYSVPPGTPPAITPACSMHASRRAVCSGGSMGTSARAPISRIFARMSYQSLSDEASKVMESNKRNEKKRT